MEVSTVRQRLLQTIDRAKRAAADRRARSDEASRVYTGFLDRTAVPLVRQIASVLKAEGMAYTVFTPAGSVRLMSDRSADDFIEIELDTTSDEPRVMGHTSRRRGQRVLEREQPIGGNVADLTEEDVLEFLLKALEPFVER
jgi:hypothetical protein